MAFIPTKSLVAILQVSVLVLVSSFTVLGHDIDDGNIAISTLAPNSFVSLPPVEPPKPHKGGHHHHHHHKHSPAPSPPPSSPPSPPSKPPTTPPAHSPPLKPPTPPAHSPPVKPPTPPVKPPTPPVVKPPTPPVVKPPTPPVVKPPTPPVKPPTPPVKPPTPPAHPPVKPPVKPPSPPAHPPVKPPVSPPHPLPRMFVGVRGVVYCKPCKYRGVDTVMGASPLEGAIVKLACNNTKYHLTEIGKTDKNGFFFIQPKWLTTAGSRKCLVFLAKSPKPECSVPTNFHNGQTGAVLIPSPPPPPPPRPLTSKAAPSDMPMVKLFDVGPFAFEPSKKLCKH